MDDAKTGSTQERQVEWTWYIGIVGAIGAAAFASRRAGFASGVGGNSASRRSEVLGLYKRIMRTVQIWPSKKREAVTFEIRQEFRNNALETDPQKLERMMAEAYAGLKELRWGAGEAARAKATPKAPKGSWPVGAHAGGVDQWALNELGLGSSSTLSEAKQAYRERAKACHPDSGSSSADAEAFKRLQKAWAHVEPQLRRSEKRANRQP
jgi:hypothetical protein